MNGLAFVILLGLVSLFGDITYEGARSITGPYLALLGASGAVVGFISGFGELIGYTLRLPFGYLSDKTGRYWLITFIGYTINLFAVPMLALADHWPLAGALIVAERFGKAIRTPARDAMLSYATARMGRGWGFGIHEAMDQVGAILGPLIVTAVLYWKGSYQMGFAFLLVPALLALLFLAVAKYLFPHPKNLEPTTPEIPPVGSKELSKKYWIYVGAIGLVAAGYVDFPLMAYHFQKGSIVHSLWIPTFFSIAMFVDAITALIFGKLYDKKGISVLALGVALTFLFAPLVFLGGFYLSLAGVVLWGIGMGAQESIMRAAASHFVRPERRGTAYGLLNFSFGICWFLGSALMGLLYDVSMPLLIIFSVGCQAAAIPLFLSLRDKY